ncbi:hypothetical protein GGQ08_003245 [Salinibacter ruber]|nr:hypothetical protein [Salinibacter ruber]MCS3655154.1 hypothetical protein [Salinibacter ruber]
MDSSFLSGQGGREWRYDNSGNDYQYYLGKGRSALEVVVTRHEDRPRKDYLQSVYSDRRDGRVNPILVVALHDGIATICGPTGEDPPVYREVRPSQAENVCRAALEKPDRLSAQQFLTAKLPQLDDSLPGVRNQGLLSTHELRAGVPRRDDWDQATENAKSAVPESSQKLVESLGYGRELLTDHSWILKDGTDGHDRAVAVFLEEGTSFDRAQEQFTGKSPVAYALNEADKKNLDYVIANRGGTLRLYTTNPEAGFGSRGKTDTYVEIDTDLLPEENAGYLWLLFSAEALRSDGTLHDIMERSKDYAADLGARLRERIYDDVVPNLAEAIARARDIDSPTKEELDETYQMTLVLLYRLLFIAYAEDERFLPLRRNDRYDERSLKRKAHRLHELVQENGEFDEGFTDHWQDVMRLSRSIHDGHDELGLPAYDGRLLSEDPDVSEAGARLSKIELTNDEFGPALVSLLIDETDEGYEGPVDFRNIGVREFGVIYEGLLESELSVADRPLGIEKDDDEKYVPVEAGSEHVEIEEGEVYLHGQSGERKATGSYYTKTRFVEHLLDYSLEPALDDHIERIERIRDEEGDTAAAEAFFDLRVADIAMGSGHFLVGAVDRIESRLYSWLTENSLPQVEEELDNLQDAAEEAFKHTDYTPTIERGQLLRRQVARRCIYGVDLNPLATELARLSLWVHTFVPGLPLTFLDYNLVTGDSLAGIGTLEEVKDLLGLEGEGEQMSLGFLAEDQKTMEEIREEVARLGRVADTSAQKVKEARDTREEIEHRLQDVRARLDILSASRVEDDLDAEDAVFADRETRETSEHETARGALGATSPLHFPAAFPELFNGSDSGFDTIVGNPPWEEATMEEKEFWSRYVPGLQGRSQSEFEQIKSKKREERPDLVEKYERELEEGKRRAEIIKNGPFPGAASGGSAPDTYKAFNWRFRQLLRKGGHAGIVLPRSAFSGAGSEKFRRNLLNKGVVEDLTFLVNKNKWVFSEIHPQYTIALLGYRNIQPGDDATLPLRGPFSDKKSYEKGVSGDPVRFDTENALGWTEKASFPTFPKDTSSVEAFRQMNEYPSLSADVGDWTTNPCTQLNSGTEKAKDDGTQLIHFIDDPPENYWPVMKGSSFDIWNPETGDVYGWGDPDVMTDYLQEKRENSYKYAGSRSPFSEIPESRVHDKSKLPCYRPRVAFRDISRRTDSRTVRTALIPPNVFVVDTGPFLLFPRGDERDESYVLGVMSSIPFDWYSRRFVETHLNFHVLNALPIPRPGRKSQLRQRVMKISGRLAAIDERYAEWADAVGVEYGPVDKEEKQEKVYELDAVVSHLYGLSREHVEVIFQTFHEGWDHRERLERVLEYYDEWAGRPATDDTSTNGQKDSSDREVTGRA